MEPRLGIVSGVVQIGIDSIQSSWYVHTKSKLTDFQVQKDNDCFPNTMQNTTAARRPCQSQFRSTDATDARQMPEQNRWLVPVQIHCRITIADERPARKCLTGMWAN
jgi:hypothetical protein